MERLRTLLADRDFLKGGTFLELEPLPFLLDPELLIKGIIYYHHRNQCQYCRLKKCLKMGMRREGGSPFIAPSIHSIMHSLHPYHHYHQTLPPATSTVWNPLSATTTTATWPAVVGGGWWFSLTLSDTTRPKTIIFEWTLPFSHLLSRPARKKTWVP